VSRIWDQYLPKEDQELIALAGYRQKMGFGTRPALVVVDINYNFTGDRDEPIHEAIKRWPNACGSAAWKALPYVRRLVDSAHERGFPVFFTTDGFRGDGWNMGSWLWKTGRLSEEQASAKKSNLRGADIHPDLGMTAQDVLIEKLKPSAFNGTPLRQLLNLLQVDTVVIAGTSTSGCVRATVIDAFSDNYRVIVAEEGCFDRIQSSHAINLFDMDAKYSDVLKTEDIVAAFDSMPKDQFKLPSGQA
jgi:maleamate amidohydrolase